MRVINEKMLNIKCSCGEYIMNCGAQGPINMQKNVSMVHGNQ